MPAELRFDATNFITDLEFEPQRQNNGILFIPNIGLMPTDTTIIALAIDTLRLPSYGTEDIQVGYFNEFVSFAGKAVFDDVDLTIKDFVDAGAMRLLDEWFNEIYNPAEGSVGIAAWIKKDMYAVMYSTTGRAARWYKMMGCFPSHIARGDIDQNTSDYVRVTVTFSVDRVVPQFMLNNMNKAGAAFALPGGITPVNLKPVVGLLY